MEATALQITSYQRTQTQTKPCDANANAKRKCKCKHIRANTSKQRRCELALKPQPKQSAAKQTKTEQSSVTQRVCKSVALTFVGLADR